MDLRLPTSVSKVSKSQDLGLDSLQDKKIGWQVANHQRAGWQGDHPLVNTHRCTPEMVRLVFP
jgi:hypothetical protein